MIESCDIAMSQVSYVNSRFGSLRVSSTQLIGPAFRRHENDYTEKKLLACRFSRKNPGNIFETSSIFGFYQLLCIFHWNFKSHAQSRNSKIEFEIGFSICFRKHMKLVVGLAPFACTFSWLKISNKASDNNNGNGTNSYSSIFIDNIRHLSFNQMNPTLLLKFT